VIAAAASQAVSARTGQSAVRPWGRGWPNGCHSRPLSGWLSNGSPCSRYSSITA
jgi:hypothetical protein